jgi:hypothetical protein
MEVIQETKVSPNTRVKKRTSNKIYKKTGIIHHPVKRQYTIYHRVNMEDYKPEEGRQPRRFITQVEAENMSDAYKLAQVHSKDIVGRATTYGDVIQDHYGFYIIKEDDSFELLCLNDYEGGE